MEGLRQWTVPHSEGQLRVTPERAGETGVGGKIEITAGLQGFVTAMKRQWDKKRVFWKQKLPSKYYMG